MLYLPRIYNFQNNTCLHYTYEHFILSLYIGIIVRLIFFRVLCYKKKYIMDKINIGVPIYLHMYN